MLSWPQDRQRWEIAPPTPKARFPSTKSTLSGHQKHALQTPKACFPSTKSTLSRHQKHAPRTPRQFAFPHRNQKTRATRPLTWSTHTPAGPERAPAPPPPDRVCISAPRPEYLTPDSIDRAHPKYRLPVTVMTCHVTGGPSRPALAPPLSVGPASGRALISTSWLGVLAWRLGLASWLGVSGFRLVPDVVSVRQAPAPPSSPGLYIGPAPQLLDTR